MERIIRSELAKEGCVRTDTQVTVDGLRDELRSAEDRRLVLEGVSWETYQRLSHEIGETRGIRLSFANGVLEIMAPDPGHEIPVDVLEDVVKTSADTMGLDWLNIKASQLDHPDHESGGQPDACFYFTEATTLNASETKIDAIIHPPELVIEVDRTSPSKWKDLHYARIGVPEFWRYDKGALRILRLEGQEYVEELRSVRFPWLSGDRITLVVKEARTPGTSPGAARRAFTTWAQKHFAVWSAEQRENP
jgi:Uma2 family endonuclease